MYSIFHGSQINGDYTVPAYWKTEHNKICFVFNFVYLPFAYFFYDLKLKEWQKMKNQPETWMNNSQWESKRAHKKKGEQNTWNIRYWSIFVCFFFIVCVQRQFDVRDIRRERERDTATTTIKKVAMSFERLYQYCYVLTDSSFSTPFQWRNVAHGIYWLLFNFYHSCHVTV